MRELLLIGIRDQHESAWTTVQPAFWLPVDPTIQIAVELWMNRGLSIDLSYV